MELSRVVIKGFRSIRDQQINFANRFQILVGVNESGKTNILRALRLIDPEQKSTARDRRNPLENESSALPTNVTFEFQMNSDESETFLRNTLKNFLVKDPRTTVLDATPGKEKSLSQYVKQYKTPLVWVNLVSLTRTVTSYTYSPSKIAEGWFACPEGVDVKVQLPDGQISSTNNYKYFYSPDFPEIPLDALLPIKPPELHALCAAELKKLHEPQIPKCVYWTYKDEYLLPSSISITDFVANPATCIPLQQMFHLAEITSIKKTIEEQKALGTNALRNLLERVAKRATKHVRLVWKEYKNIEIKLEPNGDSIDASVIDHFNRYDFSDRSDGFKRFVSFLLVLSAQARTKELNNTLILIDEAEIGLHPSGVSYLRDELIKMAETNYVVVSTHSIFMIDRKKIDRHLIIKKTNETTEISRIDHTNIFEEEVVYNALNYSVFENLLPFNLLFEGWRDKQLFEVALTKSGGNNDESIRQLTAAGTCHLQGVNDAGRVVPMLELAQREYMVISDSDEAAQKAKKKFRGTGLWLMYSDLGASEKIFLTSEDFVKASAFKSPLEKQGKKYGVPLVPLDDEPTRKPRIPQIRAWLQSKCGLEGEALRDALDQIKEDVFTSLKRAHISDEYFSVLSKLAEKMPAEP